ncbi:Fic family protein [Oceanisphaera litoralis]|uniref:Fic family protein n=1 Tax=Oceanisphaera litoralis TaxID=225144 RepID=UPI00195C926B|nr:Fic family protein [Oceanisphaera litoralis]MBM7456002.1 Fic family protein [Oceanisphaera litoralis]
MTSTWIWQQPNWPLFSWSEAALAPRLRDVRLKSGVLTGKATANQPQDSQQALDTLLQSIVASSAIENETLNVQSVRSSLARRLNVTEEHPYPVSEQSEGLAAMIVDAIQGYQQPLTLERLLQWHAWLFPDEAGMLAGHSLKVGQLRGDEPMQVVSGRLDKPKVHFEAPPRDTLAAKLDQFIGWFNHSCNEQTLDPILRAALCHLWFVTLHPFEDGNGRITRALTDMALAQADNQSIRLYAMSVAILERRNDYYRILEQTQRGNLDVTAWVVWFLDTLEQTLDHAMAAIDGTLQKTRFWREHQDAGLSPEQIKVLNRLLDGGERGFEEGISASQYQKVAKVSKATATRHLADLLQKGCIDKLPGGGRSTRYQIKR